MSMHSITVKRKENWLQAGSRGFLQNQTVGTNALNALGTIEGVVDPEIVSESPERVTLTYQWSGKDTFVRTDEHLSQYGLCRVWDDDK